MMKSGIPQLVPRDVCMACEGCCRFLSPDSEWRPRVTGDEARALMEAATGRSGPRVLKDEEGYLLVKNEPGRGRLSCVFLDEETNKCSVYPNRPLECGLYPFIIRKKGKAKVCSVHLSCPYVQDVWETDLFKDYTEALKRFLAKETVKKELPDLPEPAGSYGGYEAELKDLFELA